MQMRLCQYFVALRPDRSMSRTGPRKTNNGVGMETTIATLHALKVPRGEQDHENFIGSAPSCAMIGLNHQKTNKAKVIATYCPLVRPVPNRSGSYQLNLYNYFFLALLARQCLSHLRLSNSKRPWVSWYPQFTAHHQPHPLLPRSDEAVT